MSFDLKVSQGDLQIGSDGDLARVTDSEKLIQDILKICITPVGGNPFYPFYGSAVSKGLVGNAYPAGLTSSMASNQLRTAIQNLMTLQKAQQKDGQGQTAAELLAAIKDVDIQRNQTDPRFFRVLIQVLSRDLSVLNTNFEVTL